jgi:chromate transport protein ChrA
MQQYANYFLYFHSILRYFILLFAVVVVVQCVVGFMGKKVFKKGNRQAALMLMICCDLQLLLGLILYAANGWIHRLSDADLMKDPYKRFWVVEHGMGMIVAIILVHLGYAVSKKNMDDDRKFKRMFWFIFIALAIFVATVPWEGKQIVGRPNIPHLN